MASRSPRDRLQRLFHKNESRDPKRDDTVSTPSPPPSSPSSSGLQQHVRKTSSHRSLRDLVQGKPSNRHSKIESRRTSANVEDLLATAPTQLSPPRREPEAPPSIPVPSAAQPVFQPATQREIPREILPGLHPAAEPSLAPADEASMSPAAQQAAQRAMYPAQDLRLPQVPRQSDLSSDLQHLTLSNAAGREPYSEDVADRNIAKRKPLQNGVERPLSGQSYSPFNATPVLPHGDRHSEDVANRNTGLNRGLGGPSVSAYDTPSPLRVQKQGPIDNQAGGIGSPTTSYGGRGLNHKANDNDLRRSSDVGRSQSPTLQRGETRTSTDSDRRRIKRTSLEKALPARPAAEFTAEGRHPGHTTELADKAVDLTGIVDLSNTTDATLHEKWAPAVTHETVIQNVHNVREERITREFHTDHVFHRILPIIDIQVLPARHFVPIEGGYAEISAADLPARTGVNAQWVLAELASRGLPRSQAPIIPDRFTARTFEGTQGDYKEYITSDGVPRTEQTWVYPPKMYEQGAIETGQTYAFFMGSPDPRDDGLRARLPEGDVIGMSPLLARQRHEEESRTLAATAGQRGQGRVGNDAAPAPPPHRVFPADLVDASRAGPATKTKRWM
ncbi:hypothetical protein LTR35_009909 [Friedmanniomyces endolithicus]|uniref:Uncharacterized protein n=1 Tax=Friedmanniomyces endolithicus TaxID=329885 RepID=A0AAN6FKA9_9PEZI|nr:hypothetical protein LTS00_016652 [Friedmanniomyces endolithicus]KAK0277507.1 hypothetical protein LTR35_009909 [Friedmanniomyces endolithicus]KAK0320003.1 hypothetical protein LTR82_008938 [Friedmanniomyces endolithicus]KAK0995583.1 hypothetical protein LTR54_010399 [Friedmanniomyces endolithicus]